MHADLTTRVRSLSAVSPRAVLLHLDLGGRAFPFIAGQAVMAGLATQSIRRPYSVACSPQQARETGGLELLVGLDDDGTAGPHLRPLRAGSIVAVRGPIGRFALPRRLTGRGLVFVAGGTGIAPLRSMMWEALSRAVPPEVDVVYSARTADDLVYDAELRRLHRGGQIRYWPTVTRRGGRAWRGHRGRIDDAFLEGALRARPVCLVCGPAAFCADLPRTLRRLGVPVGRIRTEAY